jgi:hypothetical protein
LKNSRAGIQLVKKSGVHPKPSILIHGRKQNETDSSILKSDRVKREKVTVTL